jgi:hypothetical protein
MGCSTETLLALPTTVALNSLVPSLSKQLAAKPSASTATKSPAQLLAAVIACPMQVDQCSTTKECAASIGNTMLSSNPYRPDSKLGNLNHLFNPGLCQLPTDEDIASLKSRVVVVHDDMLHVLYCGSLECYSLDDLRNHNHAFKNGTDLPCLQTNSLVMVVYPQGHDYFSDGVSIIRGGGKIFHHVLPLPPHGT